MAQTSVTKPKPGALAMAPVALDEDLWFGTTDGDAAEKAAASSMAATAGTVIGAKPFPESAKRLAELSSKDNTPVHEFVQVLEQDPALSAKLLRVVNSAGFGLRQRCTSVRHAVTIVGSKHLHQIATTAAVLDMFDSESGIAVTILEHSAVMGAICRYLGAHLSLPAEDLFTIGVLHDIGKLMMLETYGERYHHLIDQTQGKADQLHPLERAEYGFDHGVLAAHVLKAWNIPDPIPKIVAWHHEPARAYKSSTIHATLVQTVRLADAIVHAVNAGATRNDVPQLALHEAASYLDISEAQLGAMWEELVSIQTHALDQKRGVERESNPQDGSATRLKAHSNPPESTAVPKVFACIECGSPTFGSTCPACKGYICADHPVGPAGWCDVCAKDYSTFESSVKFPLDPLRGAIGATAIVLLTATLGWFNAAETGLLRGLLSGVFISAFLVFAVIVGKRSYLRTRFLRERPDRSQTQLSPPIPPNASG